MKKCKDCGAENNDVNKHCHNCGAKLTESGFDLAPVRNLIARYNKSNIFIRIIIALIILYLLSVILSYAGYVFFGIPMEYNAEEDKTAYPDEFDMLDVDGDGALSYYETESMAADIDYHDLTKIFDSSDENGNGVLKGVEFDMFLNNIKRHYRDLENAEKEKTQDEENTYSPLFYSDFEDEGHESCPNCGSDQISDFYNEEYGEMDWICDDCGWVMRSDDDMYFNYWEEQGLESVLPLTFH